jgi:glyoxylase-like metal-dependent hydrolase (beta-lactamase superfamily II)
LKKNIKTVVLMVSMAVITTCGIMSCTSSRDEGGILKVDTRSTVDYLLPCKGGYLLIDTSYPDNYDLFKKGLAALNITVGEIRYIMVTHHHNDHSGFAARLAAESGATIIAHEGAVPLLHAGKSMPYKKYVNRCTKIIFSMIVKVFDGSPEHDFTPVPEGFPIIPVKGNDDHLLRTIGIRGKIICTPGHTDDSISILMDDGRAFVGDLAMNFLNICSCQRRPALINDMKQLYTSWNSIIAAGARIIYPAHGDPFPVRDLRQSMNDNPAQ